MSELIFFRRERGLSLEEIVALTGADLPAPTDRDLVIENVAGLEFAGPVDIAFADRPSDMAIVASTQAGACFVVAELAQALPARVIALISADPYRAFVQVANALYPGASRPSSLFEVQGKAGSATIHPLARVEANVTVDPAAMIGPRAEIGSGTVIGPMAVIGPDVRIGRHCMIGSGASVTNALIGDQVTIRAGCRLGDDNPVRLPAQNARLLQFGRVILQDGVQLGANCTIDRGSHLDTVVGEHTMVDNLIRIPSDVSIGRRCIISQIRGSQATGPAISLAFKAGGVIPDYTVVDAHSVDLFDAS